jgi:hypothetical protein
MVIKTLLSTFIMSAWTSCSPLDRDADEKVTQSYAYAYGYRISLYNELRARGVNEEEVVVADTLYCDMQSQIVRKTILNKDNLIDREYYGNYPMEVTTPAVFCGRWVWYGQGAQENVAGS